MKKLVHCLPNGKSRMSSRKYRGAIVGGSKLASIEIGRKIRAGGFYLQTTVRQTLRETTNRQSVAWRNQDKSRLPVKLVLDLSDKPQPPQGAQTNLFWNKELLEEFL